MLILLLVLQLSTSGSSDNRHRVDDSGQCKPAVLWFLAMFRIGLYGLFRQSSALEQVNLRREVTRTWAW